MKSVCCAVRTGSLNKIVYAFVFKWLNYCIDGLIMLVNDRNMQLLLHKKAVVFKG